MWLLDTVALSEATKLRANSGFVAWLEDIDAQAVHTSVLCLGELRRSVEMLPTGDQRDGLERWLRTDLPQWLGPRVMPVDDRVALIWGRLGARGGVSPVDALIGATAAAHGLTVVTRNTRDFDGLGVPVVNPWTP